MTLLQSFIFSLIFKKDFIYLFLERRERKETGKDTQRIGCLSCAPPTGDLPVTQACALTGNRTSNPLVLRLVLSPLSQTSQG